jgi:hypothetical protein
VSETIEEWAERRAHELDADGWRLREKQAKGAAFPGDAMDEWGVTQARALLAVRDRLVEGLTEPQRRALLHFAGGGGYGGRGGSVALRSLEAKRLAEPVDGWAFRPGVYLVNVLPLGRECARVLREGK